MRTCRRIVLHGILATGAKTADADVLESRRALSSGCSRHMIIRMPCDRPDGSSRSVVWETSLRGGACRAHGGDSAQVWETSSVAGLAVPIAGQGRPRLRLPRDQRGSPSPSRAREHVFPEGAGPRRIVCWWGCPGVRVLRGPGFGRKAREEWVMFRALLRRWCRWAASLQWIRVRCRTDESRRSWVLVACCLRVRAPAPVLAWVPLRSMGPVGPGRWSARHRSSPERSAMTRGPGPLFCAPRAAGPRAVGLCSPALRLPSMRPCTGLCRWSPSLRIPVPCALTDGAPPACAPPVGGARGAGERAPFRRRAPPASRGRMQSRAVVRNSARSYLRAPLRYDRAPSGTTARPRVRPRAPGYDRASPRTTRRSRVRPRAPRRRTAGTRPPRPHPHTKGRMTPPCWDSGFDGDSMGTVMRGERSLPWDSRKYSLEWCDRATSATLGGAGGPGALRGCDPEERADLSVAAEHERPRR